MVHQFVRLFTNFGVNVQGQVKTCAGHVTSVMCDNKNAAIRYLQLHDTVAALVGAEVPLVSIKLPASTAVALGDEFFRNGVKFANGIRMAFSTTDGTYTAAAAADQTTHVTYF